MEQESVTSVTQELEAASVKLENAKNTNAQLKALLQVQKAETQSLKEQIGTQIHYHNDLSRLFYFERTRAKNLSRTWTFSIFLHFVLMLQCWSHSKIIPFALNTFVFFLQWKRLYVPGYKSAGSISFIIFIATVYFYYGNNSIPENVASSIVVNSVHPP